jgi:hypothetical protein
MMQLVSDWWNKELAENKCWYTVDVEGCGECVVHFRNRPAGDCHAVCARCNLSCILCEVSGTDRGLQQVQLVQLCPNALYYPSLHCEACESESERGGVRTCLVTKLAHVRAQKV